MRIVSFERPEPGAEGGRGQGELGAAALGFESLGEVCHGARRVGALIQDGPLAGGVLDLNRALAVQLAMGDAGAPEAQADSLLPAEADGFLRHWDRSLDAARGVMSFVQRASRSFDPPDWQAAGALLPARGLQTHVPLPHGAGLLQAEGTQTPFGLRPLASTSLAGSEVETWLTSDLVAHACGALALVISRATHRIQPAAAARHLAGVSPAIAYQATSQDGRPLDPALGRSCDGFTALGPHLVTTDEVPDPGDLLVRTRCSGELVGDGRGKWPPGFVGELLAFISSLMTLWPGDVLLLPLRGQQTRALRDGDVVEVEAVGIDHVVRHVRSSGVSARIPGLGGSGARQLRGA